MREIIAANASRYCIILMFADYYSLLLCGNYNLIEEKGKII